MKMLSVKKICAVFLSAALLTSTISGLTVSAAEETPLILGNANLDGSEVSCRKCRLRHKTRGCRKCGQHQNQYQLRYTDS